MASGSPCACFYHMQYYYVGSIRAHRILEIVPDPVCANMITHSNYTFLKVFEDKMCAYVCNNLNPSPAHSVPHWNPAHSVPHRRERFLQFMNFLKILIALLF